MYTTKQQKPQQSRVIGYEGSLLNPRLVLQFVKYLRGIDSDKIAMEINRLNMSPIKDLDHNSYFSHLSDYLGGAILSVTRYNKGQKKYYAPTGYIINIENPDEDTVLGNYKGDGNVSNPNMFVINQWLKGELSFKRNEDVKRILRKYFKSNKTKEPLGAGQPKELDEAEKAILNAPDQVIKIPNTTQEIRYTESEIHLSGLNNIDGAFYNPNHNDLDEVNLKQEAKSINTKLGKHKLFMINDKGELSVVVE